MSALLSCGVTPMRPFTSARPRPATRSCSRTAVVCLASAAPIPTLLKGVGSGEVRPKALWESLSSELKSKTYMKDMVKLAKRKNLIDIKYDGTAFVYYLTEKGKIHLEKPLKAK